MGCGNALTNTIIPTDMINPDHMKKSQIIEKNESFNKIRRIGKGSYGEVFLIKSNKTQKEYALKAIKIKGVNQNILERIMIEVDNLKSLDHPNIISFKCAFESNIKVPLLNIITEYADNGDLEEKLKLHSNQKKYFEENELLDWIIQNCLALQYLHGKDIIHRDIKPSNIFLMKNNTIKLGDFGISKNISIFHETRTMIGSPLYIAPEIIRNENYSFKADIWSLGVTFCHLMTLDFPFEGDDDPKIIYDNILKMNLNKKIFDKEKNNYKEEILNKYSKEFIDLIKELMSLDPKKRPNINQILEKDIIKKRMDSCLKDNNFDLNDVENKIQNYEKKENEETIKDDFDDKNKKNEDMNIVIEEKNENKIKNDKMIVTMNKINAKKNYDLLRQMSLIHKNLNRAKTQK